ncbi:MAG: hypothetical protein R3B45_10190 [Bdellovibrionota bacterium]
MLKKIIKATKRNFGINIAGIIASIIMVCFNLPRLFYPSMHIDESLYIGAALRILSGDFFLTTYWFDKFFITPFTLALGILIGGENHIGFRLSSLIFSSYSTFLIVTWTLRSTKTIIGKISLLILVLSIWLSPFMMFYHISSFTDPFLLCFLLLTATKLHDTAITDKPIKLYPQKAYSFFAIASLFKLSSLMWSPILAGYWMLRSGPHGIIKGIKDFFSTTKWWILVGVCYTLANPEKLAPILWFKSLGKKNGPSFWERGILWIERICNIFPTTWLAVIFITIFLIYSGLFIQKFLKDRKDRINRIALFLFVIPVYAHLIGLWISGAITYSRYLYILLPQILLFLVIVTNLLQKNMWLKYCSASIFSILGILLLMQNKISYQELAKHLPQPASGRALYQVRDELPPNAVIHNKKFLWRLYPFNRSGKRLNACDRIECIQDAKLGREPFAAQYFLSTDYPQALSYISQAIPNCNASNCEIKTIHKSYSIEEIISEQKIRDSFRLRQWAQSLDIKYELSNDLNRTFLEHNRMFQPSLKTSFIIKTKKFPILGKQTLHISGKLILLNNELAQEKFGPGRWIAGFRIEEIIIQGLSANFVDIAPLIYHSYIVLLGPIDLPSNHSIHEMISRIELLDTENKKLLLIDVLDKGN